MASELRRVWEPAWARVVVVSTRLGDRLLRVIDRVIAKYSLDPEPAVLRSRRLRVGRADRGGVEDDPARARRRARLPGRAAELPGHLGRPAEPHRRRSLEDVLLLRLRVQERAQLRPLPRDRAHRGAHPGDADRDVLDPRAAQAAAPAHRPVQGRAALSPRPGDPRVGRPRRDHGRRADRALGRRQEPRVRRHLRAHGVERHRRDARRALRRRRPPAASAGEGVQRLHDQGDRLLAVHPGRAQSATRTGSAASRRCAAGADPAAQPRRSSLVRQLVVVGEDLEHRLRGLFEDRGRVVEHEAQPEQAEALLHRR